MIMTTETELAIDALRRDLERYSDSVDEEERQRIKERMSDTATEATKFDTPHDQVMEIIEIMNQVIRS